MISPIPTPCIRLAARPPGGPIRLKVLQYAAEQGIADEEATAKGMEEKSKEFMENVAEIYMPA